MRTQPFDPFLDDPADYCDLAVRGALESWPEGLPPPPAYLVNRLRHVGTFRRTRVWVAYDGTRPAGVAELTWYETPDNRDRAWYEVQVPRDEWSEDVVTALNAAACAVMREIGRDLLMMDVAQGDPTASWIEKRGGRRGSVEEHNVVRLDSVDRGDLAALASAAPAGYELLSFERCPDDLLEPFTRLVATMNDAPRDDMTFEDFVFTPERVRDFEDAVARRGHRMLQVVAREVATGELAAFNQVVVHPEWPEVADNEDTAVAVPHRGRGLGLWIKAANMLAVAQTGARVISTWNAASNAHMLRVNRRLGFRREHVWESWEIGVSEAEPA